METERGIQSYRNSRAFKWLFLGTFIILLFFYNVEKGAFESFATLSEEEDCESEEDEVYHVRTENWKTGESLFKTHCARCHYTDKDMTGPSLQGARERWIKESSEENFYAWIQNNDKLRRTGDFYANGIYREWDDSPMPMFNLSKEEIDDIFLYVD